MNRLLSTRVEQVRHSPVTAVLAAKRRLLEEGRDLIDLSLGDPVFPPPQIAIDSLAEAMIDPAMSRYGYQVGYGPFREAAADFMERRLGVSLDPHREILPLVGAMEGIAHLAPVVADPGDSIILPDPSFLVYRGGLVSASAEPYYARLRPEDGFLLQLDEIPQRDLERARLVYLNYPNNPTGSTAPMDYLERTVETCRRHEIVLAMDAAYNEIVFDGYRAPSVLQIPGARDVAVEFHSMSKSFAMAGWRLGWVAGNAEIIEAMANLKTYIDTGPLLGVQRAAVSVLRNGESLAAAVAGDLADRHRAAVDALKRNGLAFHESDASPFCWLSTPAGESSDGFTMRLLEEGVSVWSGTAFGQGGEGYIRIALAASVPRLVEAVDRIAALAPRRQ